MATASPHTRQRHPRHPVTEAALWLVWLAARVTGVAALTRTVHRRLRALPLDTIGDLAGIALAWSGRHIYTAHTRVRGLVHRAVIRAQLAAAELLTRPVSTPARGGEVAPARLRDRDGWFLIIGGALLNTAYLAIR